MGGLNPVTDEGHCGADYAFASIAAIEAAHFASTGELLKFSE